MVDPVGAVKDGARFARPKVDRIHDDRQARGEANCHQFALVGA